MNIPLDTFPARRGNASRRTFLKTVPALSGLVLGIGLTGLAPAADEPNKPLAVLKIVGLTAILIGIGWHHGASLRNGPGHPHQPAEDRRR